MAASNWLKKLLASTAGGAGAGAIGSYLANEDPGERDITSGALAGAAVGPTTYLGIKNLGVLARAARWIGTNPTSAKTIARTALGELNDLARLDEVSPDDLRKELDRLRSFGLKPTIADAGRENIRGSAELSATTPGPARNVAVETLRGRLRGQKPFIEKAVTDNLTPTTDVAGELARLQTLKRADANAQYGTAFTAYPTLASTELDRLAPALKHFDAFNMANDIAVARVEPPVDPADMGLREWDLVKRGLDAKINMLEKREGNDTLARELKGLRAIFVKELDDLTTPPTGGPSEYAAARNRFREYSTTQDAIEAGRDILNLKPGSKADEALSEFEKLSPADQQAFRIGLGRGILDMTEAGKEGVGLVRNVLDRKGDRLEKLFPDAASWTAFRDRLEASLRERELDYQVLSNSATARRMLGTEEQAAKGIIPFFGMLRNPSGLQGGALEWALNTLGHDPREINRLTSEQLTRLLLNPDEAANVKTLRDLDKRLSRARMKDVVMKSLVGGTVGGTAGVAGAYVGTPPEKPEGFAEGGQVRQEMRVSSPERYEAPWEPLETIRLFGSDQANWDGYTAPEIYGMLRELRKLQELATSREEALGAAGWRSDAFHQVGQRSDTFPRTLEGLPLFEYLPMLDTRAVQRGWSDYMAGVNERTAAAQAAASAGTAGWDTLARNLGAFGEEVYENLGPTFTRDLGPNAGVAEASLASLLDATTVAGGIGALGRTGVNFSQKIAAELNKLGEDAFRYWAPRALGALGLAGLTGSVEGDFQADEPEVGFLAAGPVPDSRALQVPWMTKDPYGGP